MKVTNGRALLHPIAGTRWRGATTEEDDALAAELLADPKERAEHVMLVDLGRNDLGRVSVPGSVEVPEFATIERYSHVMHIVSTVVGELAAEQYRRSTRWWRPSRPARCPARRRCGRWRSSRNSNRPDAALYGGIVGYFGLRRRHGHRDRDPDRADPRRRRVRAGRGGRRGRLRAGCRGQETINKAVAVLAAIATAETLAAAAVSAGPCGRRAPRRASPRPRLKGQVPRRAAVTSARPAATAGAAPTPRDKVTGGAGGPAGAGLASRRGWPRARPTSDHPGPAAPGMSPAATSTSRWP